MVETHNRVRLTLLVVALVGFATVTMVVDRRALRDRARDLPAWAGPLLDVAAPVQRALSYPIDLFREGWQRYVSLIGVQERNAELRAALARLEEENLQLREGLVASGRLAEHLDDDGRAQLAQVVHQVVALVEALPELVDLELNPVIIGGGEAVVTQARARLAPVPVDPGPPIRQV